MDDKMNCKIVEDLLSNYIEKLTSAETNEFIEKHIKECDSCKNMLENMRKEVNVEKSKTDKKQVNYIKKYNSKMKILRSIASIVVFVLLIVMIHTIRNMIILTNLSNKVDHLKNTCTNYYKKSTSSMGSNTEGYYKDGKALVTIVTNTPNGSRKLIKYINGDIENTYIEGDTEEGYKKIAILNSNGLPTFQGLSNYIEYDNFGTFLIMSVIANIKSSNQNGKECYKIDYLSNADLLYGAEGTFQMFIEKDTGLIVRTQNGSIMDESGYQRPIITDYEHTFNIVKDEDIVEPDINEYEITNN